MTRKRTTVERYEATVERYEAKVDRSGGPDACHPWTAHLVRGYGGFTADGRSGYAHRWGWEHYVGPIPDGLQIRHTCDNPPCQNVAHLLIGTPQDNVNDRDSRGRQASQKGEKNGNAKLTETDIQRVRELRAEGKTQREIGRKVGVGQRQVSDILSCESWAHV